jgi:xanthine/uracil permease
VSADLLRRLQRDTVLAVAVLATVALIVRPTQPRFAFGIVAGGVLIGLSYWAIRGAAEMAAAKAITGEKWPSSRGFALVKFFTRHAILALVAYAMMTRLELHPVGLLLGVSAAGVAAALEAMRAARR